MQPSERRRKAKKTQSGCCSRVELYGPEVRATASERTGGREQEIERGESAGSCMHPPAAFSASVRLALPARPNPGSPSRPAPAPPSEPSGTTWVPPPPARTDAETSPSERAVQTLRPSLARPERGPTAARPDRARRGRRGGARSCLGGKARATRARPGGRAHVFVRSPLRGGQQKGAPPGRIDVCKTEQLRRSQNAGRHLYSRAGSARPP